MQNTRLRIHKIKENRSESLQKLKFSPAALSKQKKKRKEDCKEVSGPQFGRGFARRRRKILGVFSVFW